ncbi:MAG: non-ribosomal peptide synthetase [Ruminococcus sp.]|nr:non-ribosomal peptide synthetase [Ruminococcus sp.]
MNTAKIGIEEYKSIKDYIETKLRRFEENGISYETLFSLMFSEGKNIMYERSSGYRIHTTTYQQAKEQTLRRAKTIERLLSDVPKGSFVGLSQNNSLSWIENFWGILLCGYNPLLINLRLSQDMVEQSILDCDAKAVISDKREYSVKTVMDSDITEDEEAYTPDSFGTEILVMTSGTSRHVKLCAYTAEELFYQIKGSLGIIEQSKQIQKHCENRLKLLTFLPFYHAFGLVAVYIWFSFFSRTFVELKDMAPNTITGTVKRHKVTHIFAVPLFWETVYSQAMKTIHQRGEKTEAKFNKAMALRDKLGDSALGTLFSKVAFKEVRENLFGESIRFLITGGSSVSYESVRFFNSIGYPLADGYGMSEIGITSVELSTKRSILLDRFVGEPMQGMEYKIDENGELMVKGRAIAKYIIEDGIKKPRTDNEFFRTKDLAQCVNGHYKILGRRDDLVIGYSGENLNPNLIEPELHIKDVESVCLVGVKEQDQTIPTLIVSVSKFITKERFDLLDRELKKKLSDMNLSSEIRRIIYTDDRLLIEDEYKLNRIRLTNAAKNNEFHVLSPATMTEDETDELTLALKAAFATALSRNEEDIPESADFFLDLGGSSLEYFAMVSELSQKLSLSFPTENGKTLSTVREFRDYIRKNQ